MKTLRLQTFQRILIMNQKFEIHTKIDIKLNKELIWYHSQFIYTFEFMDAETGMVTMAIA